MIALNKRSCVVEDTCKSRPQFLHSFGLLICHVPCCSTLFRFGFGDGEVAHLHLADGACPHERVNLPALDVSPLALSLTGIDNISAIVQDLILALIVINLTCDFIHDAWVIFLRGRG